MSDLKEEIRFTSINDVFWKSCENIVKRERDENNYPTGLLTGYHDLDNLMDGLQPSELVLLTGRPSTGKTTLALNIAQNVAFRVHKKTNDEPKSVIIFSLETPKDQLMNRILCSEAIIDNQKFKKFELTDEDWEKLWQISDDISKAKIYIDDTPNLTIKKIRLLTHKLKEEKGLDLVVIDYLQLIQSDNEQKNPTDYQKISEISRSLKILARELNVPVIAVSQLNYNPKNRNNKRPVLTDLYEFGSLEQDADIIAFLYNEKFYYPDTDNIRTELIVAKNRNGPTDTINLYFYKKYNRLVSLTISDETTK